MAFDAGTKDRSGLARRAKDCLKRSEVLFKRQGYYLNYWQALAEIFDPPEADFTAQRTDGLDAYDGLFSSRPQLLARKLADRIGTMTRPKGQDWFKLVARPEPLMDRDDVKAWCEASTERQRNAVYAASAGFARAMAAADRSYAIFGNSITAYTYDTDYMGRRIGLSFMAVKLRDCAWGEDKNGRVNEVHQKLDMTIEQAARLFGKDNLPKEWRDKLDKPETAQTMIKARRCVLPVETYDYDMGEKPRAAAKYASIYIACGVKEDEAGLREEYLDHFPYSVRRWLLRAGDVYALSPAASVALADGRTLNTAEAAALKGIELKVAPPRWAFDDAILGQVDLSSDGITFLDGEAADRKEAPIGTMEVGEPRYAIEYLDRKHIELAKVFYEDILQVPDREGMTLGEFTQRFKTALRDAAPVFEPIEAEYSELMEGVFALCMHAMGPAKEWGLFDEPPDGLDDVNFEFITALSEALNDFRRLQALEVLDQKAKMKAAAMEEADVIDGDAAARDSLANFPSKWTRKAEDVAAVRKQRAEQAQRAAAEERAARIAELAAKGHPENVRMLSQQAQEMGSQGLLQ